MFTGVVNLLTFKWLFSRVVRWEGRRRDLGRQSRNLESWGECYGLLRHPRSQESPIFMRAVTAVTAVTPQTALAGGKKAGRSSAAIRSYPGNAIFLAAPNRIGRVQTPLDTIRQKNDPRKLIRSRALGSSQEGVIPGSSGGSPRFPGAFRRFNFFWPPPSLFRLRFLR